MRNFDEERAERFSRPRTFQIGGETFTYIIGMRPEEYAEALAEYTGMITESAARAMAAVTGENGDEAARPRPTSNEESIGIMDRTLKNFLVDDENRVRWDRLRQRREEPITGYDVGKIVTFLISEQMGKRPTEAPDSSTSGRDRTGRTSTENSSGDPEPLVVSEV